MILVNLSKSYADIKAGVVTPEEATLGAWAQLLDDDLNVYSDVVLGCKRNVVRTAFPITNWTRDSETGRVTFTTDGDTSKYAHLIGETLPVVARWVQGEMRGAKALPTSALYSRPSLTDVPETAPSTTAPVEDAKFFGDGVGAVLNGVHVSVSNRHAVVSLPAGYSLTVHTDEAAA